MRRNDEKIMRLTIFHYHKLICFSYSEVYITSDTLALFPGRVKKKRTMVPFHCKNWRRETLILPKIVCNPNSLVHQNDVSGVGCIYFTTQ